jgi:hypothetical protein
VKKEETLRCLVKAWNFSPKGIVEGLQVEADGYFAQIVFQHETGNDVARSITIGKTVDLVVETQPLIANAKPFHTVYRFLSMRPSETSISPAAPSSGTIAGIVARLNYARHGEANGVVLESGDFIHLKPDSMRQIELNIGDHIEADGKIRAMELGGRVIEATTINGVLLKGKH